MEKPNIEQEQLKEAAGGDVPEIKPKNYGKCKLCGKAEDTLFLQTHDGLCRYCYGGQPVLVCPDCGGALVPIPGVMYEVGKPATLCCSKCGKNVTI